MRIGPEGAIEPLRIAIPRSGTAPRVEGPVIFYFCAFGRGSIETTTDMPGRSTCLPADSGEIAMRTGTRWTILVKLPVALSGGSRVKTEPVPPAMPLTVPSKTWPGRASTVIFA